jgi:hypothetical protein
MLAPWDFGSAPEVSTMPCRRAIVPALVALLALAACGERQSAEQPPRQRQVRGEYALGDATIRYVATYRDSTLLAVEEVQDFGEFGQAEAHYEVADGRLVYYRIDEQRRVVDQDQPDDFEAVSLELEFDARGSLRRHSKLVDGEPRQLVGYEISDAQHHFEQLKRRVDTVQGAAVGGMK